MIAVPAAGTVAMVIVVATGSSAGDLHAMSCRLNQTLATVARHSSFAGEALARVAVITDLV
jgi:hypothetical protein